MAKHKKTKQQKIIADLRRQLQYENQTTSSKKPSTEQAISNQAKTISLPKEFSYKNPSENLQNKTKTAYPYLKHDLFKTGVLTSSIVFAQLFLFFLLKNHIIILPMVKY